MYTDLTVHIIHTVDRTNLGALDDTAVGQHQLKGDAAVLKQAKLVRGGLDAHTHDQAPCTAIVTDGTQTNGKSLKRGGRLGAGRSPWWGPGVTPLGGCSRVTPLGGGSGVRPMVGSRGNAPGWVFQGNAPGWGFRGKALGRVKG